MAEAVETAKTLNHGPMIDVAASLPVIRLGYEGSSEGKPHLQR